MLDPATLAELATAWSAVERLMVSCGLDIEQRRASYAFSADPTGQTAWRPDTANSWWAKARIEAAVAPSIRLHDLRHFQATQLLDAGVPVPTVAARLGHADGTTTMKIYAHRTRRADQQAADVVGNLLSDGQRDPSG